MPVLLACFRDQMRLNVACTVCHTLPQVACVGCPAGALLTNDNLITIFQVDAGHLAMWWLADVLCWLLGSLAAVVIVWRHGLSCFLAAGFMAHSAPWAAACALCSAACGMQLRCPCAVGAAGSPASCLSLMFSNAERFHR